MPRSLILALVLAAIGFVASVVCLLQTTAATMLGFFFVGLPCFAIAAALYVRAVFVDLRRHDVL